jgi:hypothetical protein
MPATGPVTIEGKARSAMNAQVHGLTSRRFELLPGEDPAEFELLVLRLRQEWAAMGPGPVELVERLATAEWRLVRARALEARLLVDTTLDDAARPQRLATFGRYIRGIERTMSEARRELRQLSRDCDAPMSPDDPRVLALESRHAALCPPPAPSSSPPTSLNRAQRRRLEAAERQRLRAA